MEFIFAALSFLLGVVVSFMFGYFGQKIMDTIYDRMKIKKRRKKIDKNIKENDEDIINEKLAILPLIYGKPSFDLNSFEISLDTHSKFLLRFPDELISELPHGAENFSSEDIFLDKFDYNGMFNGNFFNVIEKSRVKVAKNFINREEGMYFNGLLYGILHSDGFSRTCDEIESPILTLKLFQTDYFSHKVMEDAKLSFLPYMPDFTLESLNSTLKVIRTSFGVSIIVVLKSSNQIIMTRRSPNASYSFGKSWIYVSATETFSETDFDNYSIKARLDLCVKRGLVEELAITEQMYKADDMIFTDYFFETHFMQDGIVAIVQLDERIDFPCIERSLKMAKDSELEIEKLILVDNDKKSIVNFIEKNSDDMRDQTKFALKSYCARLVK